MADLKYIEILNEGVEVWNQWRKENAITPDLSKADLSQRDLIGINLRWADLHNADLHESNLQGADLSGANLHVANLSNANLERADLHKTDFRGANLRKSNLSLANLKDANFRGASLREANLQETKCQGTNFRKANFRKTIFRLTKLTDTLFKNSINLDYAVHLGHSTIDWNTIRLAEGRLPEAFIEGVCVPEQREELISYNKALLRGENPELQIIREIEFEPQYKQAGLNILSYFGQIVQNKYPDDKVTVRIEQNGNSVRMDIMAPDGSVRERIEETLEKYGMVIKGEIPPEDIIDNKIEIIELKNELRLAQVRIESQKELLDVKNASHEELVGLLQELVNRTDESRKGFENLAGKILDQVSPIDAITAFSELQNVSQLQESNLSQSQQTELLLLLKELENQESLIPSERKDKKTIADMVDRVQSLLTVSTSVKEAWSKVGPVIMEALDLD